MLHCNFISHIWTLISCTMLILENIIWVVWKIKFTMLNKITLKCHRKQIGKVYTSSGNSLDHISHDNKEKGNFQYMMRRSWPTGKNGDDSSFWSPMITISPPHICSSQFVFHCLWISLAFSCKPRWQIPAISRKKMCLIFHYVMHGLNLPALANFVLYPDPLSVPLLRHVI